jgi:hypothetical protein
VWPIHICFEKTQNTFAFHFIGKQEFGTILLGGEVQENQKRGGFDQGTSQVCVAGYMAPRPEAPALAQRAASTGNQGGGRWLGVLEDADVACCWVHYKNRIVLRGFFT